MIRLGVVGYGGRIHYVVNDAIRGLAPDARVVGVVDPDEAGVRKRLGDCDKQDAVFYKSLDEMVRQAKLDALLIGTRCNLHAVYGAQAAKYDLPLYLEKPIAVSMEQAIALEKAFENSRCQVVVSFPLRVSPLAELARKYIARGEIGQPIHVHAFNFVNYGTVYWEQAYRDYSITGGLFLQKATHDLDYLAYLMGKPIVRVAAMLTRGKVYGGDKPAGLICSKCDEQDTCIESPRNRKRNGSGGNGHPDKPCVFSVDSGLPGNPTVSANEDCSSVVMEFEGGAHGVYSQVFFTRRDAGARGAIVSGYQGTVSFDWAQDQFRYVRHHAPFTATEKVGQVGSHAGGDQELAFDFLGVIRGKNKSRTPIQTGLASVYACLAARESAETGQFVPVRQVGASLLAAAAR
ncbi:MAG: Gfo/Idh/MocA family oxidoreductase [Phycisphaeraceae bacterium]|nr:Gfo/Idh/MocA family oxidoreductase [Phycisphaeraceae bacterium]